MRQIRWSRVAINLTVLALIVIWTVPTLGLFITSFRDKRGDLQLRLVDRLHRSAGRVHPRELREGALRRRRPGERLPQQPRRHDPGRRHPHPHRGLRRVRVRLDGVLGPRVLFVTVVALLVVPLQMALIPILKAYLAIDLNGTFLAVWLAHAGFGLPLAIYLLLQLHRPAAEGPHRVGEDRRGRPLHDVLPAGAAPLGAGARLVRDLPVPVGVERPAGRVDVPRHRQGGPGPHPRARVDDRAGQDWQLLTAGAFVTMLLPVLVFLCLQRYFVRGLLAGSVKG